MMWYIRWQITRGLIWLAFAIAPRSAARDLFITLIDGGSDIIMRAIGKETPNDQ